MGKYLNSHIKLTTVAKLQAETEHPANKTKNLQAGCSVSAY